MALITFLLNGADLEGNLDSVFQWEGQDKLLFGGVEKYKGGAGSPIRGGGEPYRIHSLKHNA